MLDVPIPPAPLMRHHDCTQKKNSSAMVRDVGTVLEKERGMNEDLSILAATEGEGGEKPHYPFLYMLYCSKVKLL